MTGLAVVAVRAQNPATWRYDCWAPYANPGCVVNVVLWLFSSTKKSLELLPFHRRLRPASHRKRETRGMTTWLSQQLQQFDNNELTEYWINILTYQSVYVFCIWIHIQNKQESRAVARKPQLFFSVERSQTTFTTHRSAYIQLCRRHLLQLASKADTHFTVAQTVESWIDLTIFSC